MGLRGNRHVDWRGKRRGGGERYLPRGISRGEDRHAGVTGCDKWEEDFLSSAGETPPVSTLLLMRMRDGWIDAL